MTDFDAKSCSAIDSPCPDCSPFLNWNDGIFRSEREKVVIFRSLVATLKLQHACDDSLEGKAVTLLKYVSPLNIKSTTAFLHSFASNTDASLRNFVQCVGVLISSPNQTITTEAMRMVEILISKSHAHTRATLVNADLIPQLINTLNPPSLSFTEAVDIHSSLMITITSFLWLASPYGLAQLGIEDHDKQQTVHEAVLQRVLAPSKKYICHLCAIQFSIIDGMHSRKLMALLAQLLGISPFYQPTIDFVLHMPVFLTIPSCLAFFEQEGSIWTFLYLMVHTQREWYTKQGTEQQIWKTVHRMLRMEGMEDVIEAKLRNDRNMFCGGDIITRSIEWNNLLGMNRH
ncbi:hypothetical protein BLNAU_21740 [Blattamonas nauphoetae]|uniref:Uncharacterized protein n=1 Tax=Blattamonas nauphoetae TaxID=2049346 RepID=A0ABQ9WZ76_9EUKA|nr:hypothetical protein BLNAU_21740 [Blattamonas nauphoetae]